MESASEFAMGTVYKNYENKSTAVNMQDFPDGVTGSGPQISNSNTSNGLAGVGNAVLFGLAGRLSFRT